MNFYRGVYRLPFLKSDVNSTGAGNEERELTGRQFGLPDRGPLAHPISIGVGVSLLRR